MVGAGLPDYGNVGITPVRVAVPSEDLVRDYNYRSPFNHATEQMYPGYYSVVLDGPVVTVELAAAGTHAGLHRYQYGAAPGPRTLLINVCNSVDNGNTCFDARVNVSVGADGNTVRVRTYLRHKGNLTGRNGRGIDVWVDLVVRGPAALAGAGVWQDGAVVPGATAGAAATSGSLGTYLYFGDAVIGAPDNSIVVEAGLSFVSEALAEANREAQVAARAFDAVVSDTTELWRTTLLGVLPSAAAPRTSDLVKLYTAVYRTQMSPTIFSETDGSYVGMDNAVHKVEPGHRYYSDLSLWDTFRTQNPWLVLTTPDVGLDIARSIVLMIEQGGDLPRWYGTPPMLHTHSVSGTQTNAGTERHTHMDSQATAGALTPRPWAQADCQRVHQLHVWRQCQHGAAGHVRQGPDRL
jgi:putative alpha-1,2-mannosidase